MPIQVRLRIVTNDDRAISEDGIEAKVSESDVAIGHG